MCPCLNRRKDVITEEAVAKIVQNYCRVKLSEIIDMVNISKEYTMHEKAMSAAFAYVTNANDEAFGHVST